MPSGGSKRRPTVSMKALRWVGVALSVLSMASLAEAGKNESVLVRGNAGEIVTGGHLSVDHGIRDVLNHPALAGHGQLILPWDERTYDEGMQLRDIGSLLPYHSHVRPNVVVGALNRLIDDVSSGTTVFFAGALPRSSGKVTDRRCT